MSLSLFGWKDQWFMSKSPVTRMLYSVNEKCALRGSALSMRETQHGLKKQLSAVLTEPRDGIVL